MTGERFRLRGGEVTGPHVRREMARSGGGQPTRISVKFEDASFCLAHLSDAACDRSSLEILSSSRWACSFFEVS